MAGRFPTCTEWSSGVTCHLVPLPWHELGVKSLRFFRFAMWSRVPPDMLVEAVDMLPLTHQWRLARAHRDWATAVRKASHRRTHATLVQCADGKSTEALRGLAAVVPNLTRLDVSGCHTIQNLDEVVSWFPRLKRIHSSAFNSV